MNEKKENIDTWSYQAAKNILHVARFPNMYIFVTYNHHVNYDGSF